MTQPSAAPAPAPAAPAAVPARPLALAEAALNAAGIMWIQPAPDDRPRPCWYAWVAGSADQPGVAYVVNGPGEQDLPYLPADVVLHLKSKDSGGRLTKVAATAEKLAPTDPRWEAAAEALAAGRLNSTDDVRARWREQCTITLITPVRPLEDPKEPETNSGSEQIAPSSGTTGMNLPWHIRGRKNTVRARRQLAERAEQAE